MPTIRLPIERSSRPCVRALAVALLLLASAASAAQAQFYKVYGWETPPKGGGELTYWTTWIARSDGALEFGGDSLSREHLWAHSAELEYALSNRLVVGAYADFQDPADAGFRYTRARGVLRYRFANKGELFLDPALYAEYYVPREGYGDEKLELRLILEKDLGDFRVDLNPIVEKTTSGPNVGEGLAFTYAAGVYWRRYYHVQAGVEAFGETGPLSNFDPADEQDHRIFGTLRFRWGQGFLWELGAGVGLTQATDDLTLKSILSYEFW